MNRDADEHPAVKSPEGDMGARGPETGHGAAQGMESAGR